MPRLTHIDGGQEFDWGRASADYAKFRPGPPALFYDRLRAFGVGLPGQYALDLGTGTGHIARNLAQRGCKVDGIDISPGQIAAAKDIALKEGVSCGFYVASADSTQRMSGVYDVVIANQCWFYFDPHTTIPETLRVLKLKGVLVVSFANYLSLKSSIARRTDEIVLKYNPQWSGALWSPVFPQRYTWLDETKMVNTGAFYFEEHIPFTREIWRGRMRACRGVAASMTPETIAAIDGEIDAFLRSENLEEFTIPHRFEAHFFARS